MVIFHSYGTVYQRVVVCEVALHLGYLGPWLIHVDTSSDGFVKRLTTSRLVVDGGLSLGEKDHPFPPHGRPAQYLFILGVHMDGSY